MNLLVFTRCERVGKSLSGGISRSITVVIALILYGLWVGKGRIFFNTIAE